jgi:hypothetical protein
MTCRVCSYQWCWICTGKYSDGHYSRGGPCGGLQYSKIRILLNLDNNMMYHNSVCRCLNRMTSTLALIGMWIGIVLLCLIFGSSILAVLYTNNFVNWRRSKWLKSAFICITVAIAGLMFQPLVLILFCVLLALTIVFTIIVFPIAIKCFRKIYHKFR